MFSISWPRVYGLYVIKDEAQSSAISTSVDWASVAAA